MNPINYFLWAAGLFIGLLLGPIATESPVAVAGSNQQHTYAIGITEEEFNHTYHQTLCYDYMLVRGSMAKAVESDLVIEKDGLFYGNNAGVSWGACPALGEEGPDVYVTSCTKEIGDMRQTYGWKADRGWITDQNDITVMYLIHAVSEHPCDASSVKIFDTNSGHQNWYSACQYEPVLFTLSGETARCDVNPIRSARP